MLGNILSLSPLSIQRRRAQQLSLLPFLAFYYAHALAANTTKLLATNSSESLNMKHVTFCVRRLLSPVCR
jgi:hypothetical protein